LIDLDGEKEVQSNLLFLRYGGLGVLKVDADRFELTLLLDFLESRILNSEAGRASKGDQ